MIFFELVSKILYAVLLFIVSFSNRNIILPAGLIADVKQILPLFPVTFTMGVFPFLAQVVPNMAVSLIALSSSK